jgi:hypothetical protein
VDRRKKEDWVEEEDHTHLVGDGDDTTGHGFVGVLSPRTHRRQGRGVFPRSHRRRLGQKN